MIYVKAIELVTEKKCCVNIPPYMITYFLENKLKIESQGGRTAQWLSAWVVNSGCLGPNSLLQLISCVTLGTQSYLTFCVSVSTSIE